MKDIFGSIAIGLVALACAQALSGSETPLSLPPADSKERSTGPCEDLLSFPKIAYQARVSDSDARVAVTVWVASNSNEETRQTLFQGDLAILPLKLPPSLRIERTGNTYTLVSSKRGRYEFGVEFMAKVIPQEPWNQVSFTGPRAAIASAEVAANGNDLDVRLLTGTQVTTTRSNGVTRATGYLGGESTVAFRWSKSGTGGDIARKAVLTAETTTTAQITPSVIKYSTRVEYGILQGRVSHLVLSLPPSQTLTKLVGEQIRDWELKPSQGYQALEVQLMKPLEHQFVLTLYSEQTLESREGSVQLNPPQPLELEREAGLFTIGTEDTGADVLATEGLRQVNAEAGALAAYRFNGRPFKVELKLKRIEPEITVTQQVHANLEETRFIANYSLALTVDKAGIYGLDLRFPDGFVVAQVKGKTLEDWKPGDNSDGRKQLHLNFKSRISGEQQVEVILEQPLKIFPDRVLLQPVRVVGAVKESAEVGVAAAPGIRVKTAELLGVREISARSLQIKTNDSTAPSDEMLGYKCEQPDWKITLASERLAPRIISEIFNLITIGDGIVGGSATIRYGLLNQGVQEFELVVPPTCKNVEFTGPNIRRKDQKADGHWTIGLQDKVWGGYTLVVTYDFQFDPKGATLAIAGIHTAGVERETGSLAITTASSLKLTPKEVSDSLRRIDELELAPANRALITRSVLLAYQYDDPAYQLLGLNVQRFEEAGLLSAVADRTQLTTVLTEAGEMLTQASFMVKNNDKQFQRFKLPAGAKFWSCHVNGQPVRAERDGDWLMAPLPREANRNQAFAVDIVYAATNGVKPSLWPRTLALLAPQTDVPNTYAEWQFYLPAKYRFSGLGGNMTPVRGTTYDLQDAWQKFTRFYWEFLHESGPGLLMVLTLGALVVALIGSAIRRGASGVISVLVVFAIVVVLAGMLLPALSRAKARAQRINGMNNLKQIGLAARTFALDNTNRLPNSFEEMINELSTDKVTYDPETGQRYTYLGAGYDLEKILPESVIAFSPPNTRNYRDVVLADGSVQQLSASKFDEMERRGFILMATPNQVAQNQQVAAVRGAQLQSSPLLNAAPNSGAAQVPARAPRMRSIQIEVPREGQSVSFTKVLHLDAKPLVLRVNLMSLQMFQTIRMCLQLAAFLSGLVVLLRHWNTGQNTLVLTLGLALCLCAVGDLLLAWRMLHLAFIWLAPVLALSILGWIAWRFWPRPNSGKAEIPSLKPGLPPAVAALVLAGIALTPCAATPVSTRVSPPAAVAKAVLLKSATYTVNVSDQVAKVEVLLSAEGFDAGQRVPLFRDDVAVERFSSKPAGARLVREPDGVSAVLERRGQTVLELSLIVKLGGDVTKRQLAFGVPSTLSSHWDISIDQTDADVEFPAAVWSRLRAAGQQTRVEALLSSGERVEMTWAPKVKRAAEIAANVICRNSTMITFGSSVLNSLATLDYQVTQGEMRQARVQLPAGHRLLRLEGESIRTWDLNTENGEQVVRVELLKDVSPAYRLVVETERPLEKLPTLVKADVPHPIGVTREMGLLAIRGDEDVDLSVQASRELYRVEVAEFIRESGLKAGEALTAFRFAKPGFDLQVNVSPLRPQIEAVTRNQSRVGIDQVNLIAAIDYSIKRAGVFGLKVALPDGYRLEHVTGTNILQAVEHSETPGRRVLEVTLKERATGSYSLGFELVQPFRQLPGSIEVLGVYPLDAEKTEGVLVLSSEPGVALKPVSFDGLTEIPATSAGATDSSSTGSSLAYKFVTSEAQPGQPWKLTVQTETVASWVRAELVTTLTLSESIISGRTQARFDIQNAPIKQLHLRVPETFKNVEISAPNIRRRDRAGEDWTIEFQGAIRGPHVLTITWEQPGTIKTNYLELRGVSAESVERETGVLVVVTRPPLQVAEKTAAELKPTDLRDLPDWAGQPDEGAVLAYRYLRPDYKLGVEATRFAEAEVLQALVEKLSLSTVLADDGQMMTEMSLLVRNRDRQHLEITLPPGASVWSAFVAGQPVRPSLTAGKLLLPLEHSLGDDSAIPIDLVYVASQPFPRGHGSVELISPKFDAPLNSARWEVFLPPDYAYTKFAGTMAHELPGASLEAAGFSFLEYSSRESTSKAQWAKELKSELISAQQKLSSGNVKEAMTDFNRARNKSDLATANNSEARQIEAELRRAQGNNLIEAQNAFSTSYAQIANRNTRGAGSVSLKYDNETAEAQWAKLQQAQDLGAASVQPIHINLPTRGLHHAFTQWLQTESGKPITVRFSASNLRVHHWTRRALEPCLGFLLLWAIVHLGVHLRTNRPAEQETA